MDLRIWLHRGTVITLEHLRLEMPGVTALGESVIHSDRCCIR